MLIFIHDLNFIIEFSSQEQSSKTSQIQYFFFEFQQFSKFLSGIEVRSTTELPMITKPSRVHPPRITFSHTDQSCGNVGCLKSKKEVNITKQKSSPKVQKLSQKLSFSYQMSKFLCLKHNIFIQFKTDKGSVPHCSSLHTKWQLPSTELHIKNQIALQHVQF